MFKIIIAGGRDFANQLKRPAHYVNDSTLGNNKLSFLLRNKKDIEVVSGCAEGADTFGEEWASSRNILIKQFPADWDDIGSPHAVIKYTKAGKPYNAVAGHIRNQEMADYVDALILFWDGKSKGSYDMLKRARKRGLEIRIIRYE